MPDSFQGMDKVDIQPGDSQVPHRFKITIATSSERNDGGLPFGSSMIACTIGADFYDGTTAPGLVAASTEDGNTVVVRLDYSTGLSSGRHKLTFTVDAGLGTTSSGFRTEFDFDRVWVVDR